jgi:hypothetical protein
MPLGNQTGMTEEERTTRRMGLPPEAVTDCDGHPRQRVLTERGLGPALHIEQAHP